MRPTILVLALLLSACHHEPSRCADDTSPTTNECTSSLCPTGQACKQVACVPVEACTCDERTGELSCADTGTCQPGRVCTPIPDQTSCAKPVEGTSCTYDIAADGCLAPVTCLCNGFAGFECPSPMYCDTSGCSANESDCGGVCKLPSR